MKVKLEEYEIEMAAFVGIRRKANSISKKRKSANYNLGGWDADVEGALAEMAVGKALNIYWNGSVNTFTNGPNDVGKFEVRSTLNKEGSLVIRPKDSDSETYILVTGSCPDYELVGWMKGKEAKNKTYIKNPGNKGIAFFVPQDKLKPMNKLKVK